MHVSHGREGRESSEVGDHAVGGETEEDGDGVRERSEGPGLVEDVGADGVTSNEGEGADVDEVGRDRRRLRAP